MADMDWGNTRAPMQSQGFPQTQPQGYAPQGQFHAQAHDPSYGQAYGAPQMADHGHYAAQQTPHHAALQSPQMNQPMMAAPAAAGVGAGHGYAAAPGGGDGGMLPPAAPDQSRIAPLVNYAGAAVSLALIVGLGLWGYQLAMRDVSGIPVVRALEGPMHIQPEDPGGFAAAHQGLAVNSVQASGEASAPSDRVALAPPPQQLDAEDLPANPSAVAHEGADGDGAGAASSPLQPIDVAALSVAEAPIAAPQTGARADAGADADQAGNGAALPADPVAAALAIAEQITRDIAPLTSTDPIEEVTRTSAQSPLSLPQSNPASQTAQAATGAATGPKIIPASVPGVSRSLFPKARPANLPQAASLPASPPPAATSAKELAPNAIPAGTRLVQLGAFDSEAVARAEWEKLSARFEDYLPGKTRVVQKAQSGGKTFYRLRAMGFKDLADARRFCSALMAGKAACIPVVTR